MKDSLIQLFKRDLDRLQKEIAAYTNDEILWQIDKDIKNSGGNLAIHIIGNLNHFVGATLGNTGYVRKRDAEFNDKNISRKTITNQIAHLINIIEVTLFSLNDDDLNKTYPINVFGEEMTVQYFLIHLQGHLNYHLGQINYHRRLLDEC